MKVIPPSKTSISHNDELTPCPRILNIVARISTPELTPTYPYSLRGIGGNVVIIEEATYILEETFREIIAPILSPTNVCLIALSTIGEKSTNFFSRMLKSGMFKVHEVKYICKKCLDAGVRKVCPHNVDYLPPWTQESRMEKMRKIGSTTADGTGDSAYLRESLGVVIEEDDTGAQCFSASRILEIKTNPRRTFDRVVRYVFCCIDPCAGSDDEAKRLSDFAVVTMANQDYTILGMEAIDVVEPEQFEGRLIDHLHKIRRIPMCERATIVLDIESGTGLEASRVDKLVRNHFLDVITMRDFLRKPGTKTDEAAKRDMVVITNDALKMGEVFIHENFVTTHPNPDGILNDFFTQMENYTRVFATSTSNRRASQVTFTGKTKPGMKDDLSVTFQRCIRAMIGFKKSDKYDKYRR